MQVEQLDIYSLPVFIDSEVKIGSKVLILDGNNEGKKGFVSNIYLSKCMYPGHIVHTVKVETGWLYESGGKVFNTDQLLRHHFKVLEV